ncbi:MAG: hypothetical protein QOG31_100 [Thermoplasmata archaeon]|jgi:hypothetical protein|nr:hypothetical protein [Thermoplasmata archaeon]
MARSLRCPRCSTVVTVEEGQTPRCPSCGFGGPVAATPAPAAHPQPGQPAPPAPTGFSAPPPYGQFSPLPPGGRLQTSGAAVASLVLGIATVCVWWLPFFGVFVSLVAGVLAIILGAVGIKQVNQNPTQVTGKGLAIAGLVLGIVGLAIAASVLLFLAALFGSLRNA